MNSPVEIFVPQTNPNDESAVLVRWHVEAGTRVRAGQAVATLETSKAAVDVESPESGYVFYEADPGSILSVGSCLALLCETDSRPSMESSAARSSPPDYPGGMTGGMTRKAAQMIRQHGLSPSDFDSVAGRIEVADVEKLLAGRATQSAGAGTAPPDCAPLEQSPAKMIEILALGDVYRSAIPSMVAISLSCEKTDARLQALARVHGPVTLLELIIREAAQILPAFSELNGYYAEGKAWRYSTVAIGFAVNLGRSLRVPVVHGAAEVSQLEVARTVRDLSLRYMRDELQVSDLTGGTFTVTDLSGFGVEHFIPVLNQRQAAILGVCAERPGSGRRDLILGFDHRMADGMRAAGFLAQLRDCLETPRQE